METPYSSSIDPNARCAETPPLEAFRLQMSLVMSGPTPTCEEDDLFCEFLDISSAHILAPIERLVSVSTDGMVHKLGQTMCGLQGAGAGFDRMSGNVAKTPGCKLGTSTKCVLTRGNLVAQPHGDDDPALETRRDVGEFCVDLAKHLLLKSRGVLGHDRQLAISVKSAILVAAFVGWMRNRSPRMTVWSVLRSILTLDTQRSWNQQLTFRKNRNPLEHLESVCHCQTKLLHSLTKDVDNTGA